MHTEPPIFSPKPPFENEDTAALEMALYAWLCTQAADASDWQRGYVPEWE